MSGCCLTPNEQVFIYIMAGRSCMQWNDIDIRFVLDQHTQLGFYSASSLKQQSVGRNVAPLRHIIHIISSQPVFALTSELYFFLAEKQIKKQEKGNRRGNQEWTIHRNWQHRVQKTQDEDKQNKKHNVENLKQRASRVPPKTGTTL